MDLLTYLLTVTEPRTKVHGIQGISLHWRDPNVAKFRLASTKSVLDIRCGKILHSSGQRVVGDVGACPSPSQLPLPTGNLNPHLIRDSLGQPDSAKGISIGSAVYAQLTADSPYTLQWAAASTKLPISMGIWTTI